ncbi:MAG: fibro-slime domain-containing protein, partial [Clostridiales bacterium]|nr:fibro-slime domain-containing protein [Clostridiales bacterium]
MRKNKNGGGITQKGYKCVRSLLAVVLAALLMFGTFGTALAEDLSDVNITSEEQTENDTDIQDEGEELSGDDSDIDGDTADGSTSDDIFTETTDGTGEDDPAAPAEEGDALDGETDEEEPDAEEEDNLIAAASIEPDGKAESEYTLELGDSLVIPGVEVTDNSGGALNVGKYYEPASMVEADKSYVLMNCETSYSSSGTVKSYYILSNTTATTSNGSNTGIAFTSVSGGTYSGLECIERTDADPVTWSKSDAESGKYYLQTTVEGTDANGNPETTTRYAGTSFNSDYSSSVWDEGQAAGDLSLTDKDSATAFSVLSAGDDYYYPGRGYVFLEGEDSGRSNVIAYDSPSAASFAISWWPGDEAYIWYFCTPCIVVTPSGSTGDYTITVDDSTVTIHVSDHHAESVDPANTTINLFDYWITDGDSRFEPDYFSVSDFTSGINGTGSSGSHTLLFYKDHDGIGTNGYYNDYEYSKLYKGIVSSTLGDDGYPMLNSTVTSSSESLAYLFNPDETSQAGKTTFTDVRGLLQKDDKGYYYYDSTQNFAEFDEESNAFTLYNDWKVTDNGEGQFFPFNKYSELSQSTDSYSNDVNHYFGMTMTTSFTQQAGGKSLSTGEDTTFEFSGDDDVWIFIDGVLVADIGGIHDKASATIDFSTGEVKVRVSTAPEEGESSDSGFTYGYSTKLYDAYEAVGKENTTTWNDENNPTTFAEDTTHTLNFFYLERGNGASNLALTTNLETSPESEIIKTDQDGNAVEGATFAVYAADSDGNYTTESNTSITSAQLDEELAKSTGGYYYDNDSGNICDSSDDV